VTNPASSERGFFAIFGPLVDPSSLPSLLVFSPVLEMHYFWTLLRRRSIAQPNLHVKFTDLWSRSFREGPLSSSINFFDFVNVFSSGRFPLKLSLADSFVIGIPGLKISLSVDPLESHFLSV